MKIQIDQDYGAMCKEAASHIAQRISTHNECGKPTVLGLPTGDTAVGVYKELVRLHREQGLDFSNVVTFNLDEYWPIEHDNPESYHHFMQKHLFSKVNIPAHNIHIPSGEVTEGEIEQHCEAYEEAIQVVGGIDLMIVGIGQNGHVGFNEPSKDDPTHRLNSRTRKITLAASTCTANNVPMGQKAITMGLGTVNDAKEIMLIASGEAKVHAVEKAVRARTYDSRSPATMLGLHQNVSCYLDDAAASANVAHIARQQGIDSPS